LPCTIDEEIILGVDTHNDAHVAAVITLLGVLLGTQAFPTTGAGYPALLAWPADTAGYAAPAWRAPVPTARP
jgi:hypothetical protein